MKTILLSRTDSIGDVVLTLPMAYYLKKKFPGCQIGFLGKKYTADVILNCPYVDQFIDLDDFMNGSCLVNGIVPDTIIHVFPKVDIAKKAKELKILNRIGTTNRAYHWLYCNRLVRLSRKNSLLHESQLNLKLIMDMIPELSEISEIKLLDTSHLNSPVAITDSQKFHLVMHPKSKGSAREWSLDNYSELIRLLNKDKVKIYVSGTMTEQETMKEFLSIHENEVENLCGKLSLSQFMKLISECDGLLACSTGPLHLAGVLGIHAIGIYPPMRPIHPGRWAPLGPKTKVFVKDSNCNSCRSGGSCACINSIRPQAVADYIHSLLK